MKLALSASSDSRHTPDSPSAASPVTPGVTRTVEVQALPPGLSKFDVITDLQQFAALIREITIVLYNPMVLCGWSTTPFLQKEKRVLRRSGASFSYLRDWTISPVASKKIFLFQKVRAFGNDVQFDSSIIYGAIGAYLLPVLYVVLGAFAYRLRKFAAEIRSMTYPSQANSARVVTAAICGAQRWPV